MLGCFNNFREILSSFATPFKDRQPAYEPCRAHLYDAREFTSEG